MFGIRIALVQDAFAMYRLFRWFAVVDVVPVRTC